MRHARTHKFHLSARLPDFLSNKAKTSLVLSKKQRKQKAETEKNKALLAVWPIYSPAWVAPLSIPYTVSVPISARIALD